ncbi:hypothetical protein MSAS_19730 [Mycobacterium saskatchewanense]|uniref:hypothetical protein n=1 Tax=Mycobacterium saskatchewanense TaxID=220927 RepID=UPI0011533D85|nr:hypothetical protein [Mycobacterium saskatchewanense]BBX62799.1 hypothetical protein MSAS_19730 [Mycobacterium saskatchewanense]
MSGQLVGEVIAAADALRTRGLSARGFHALIAIAEKAETHTRQGSVRWDHIRAVLYGASKRTAERAVQDLRDAKIIDLVEPGFKNSHRARAPKYEIRQLDPDNWVAVSANPGSDIQVVESNADGSDTQVSASESWIPTKPALDTDKTGIGYRHPAVVLDVSLTEFLDREKPPPRFCPDHMPAGTTRSCPPCGNYRERRDAWDAAREKQRRTLRDAIRRAIDECDCDAAGRLDDLSDCPEHPNFRQFPTISTKENQS